MTILGAESFNGPLNQGDLNAKGYWAGVNAITGAGVPFGAPLQYRSVMRASNTLVSGYPFASTSNNDSTPSVINLGLAADYYAAGGFWTGITATYLGMNPMFMSSDGTKLVGVVNSTFASGLVSTDYVNWNAVTNTAVGTAFTVQTPISYSAGAYYFGGQLGNLVLVWATGTDMPGAFTTTQITASSTPSLLSNLGDFRRSTVGGAAYYACGQSTSGSTSARIIRSTTGATGSWTAALSGETTGGSVSYMFELNDVLYATGIDPVGGTTRARVWRSTDGVTWTSVWTNTSIVGAVTSRMAHNGVATVVVVGALGQIASSSDDGVTWVARTSGTSDNILEVMWTGSEFAAITNTRATLISPDGLTWTVKPGVTGAASLLVNQPAFGLVANNEYLIYSQQAAVGFGFQWDKVEKVWKCIRAPEISLSSQSTNVHPVGTFFGTPSGGVLDTISGGRSLTGIVGLTTGVWAVGADGTGNWGTAQQNFTGAAPTANTPYRIEMEGVSVPGQPVPTFDVTWYLNGVRSSATPLRVTATAGQSVLFVLSSSGFNQFYNFVYGNKGGARNTTVLGNVWILKKTNTTDVLAQWERIPTDAASNAAAAQGNGSATQRTSSIQAVNLNDTDEYSGATPTLPVGYRVTAIKVSAGAQRQGIPTPTIELGLVDNGDAMPTASATLSGGTTTIVPLTKIYDADAADQPWTVASVGTTTIAIKRTA